MSLGTYYSNGGSARSTIIEDVIDYFKLDVEVKLKSDTPNYTDLFPLGKTPAFITSDGVKFHELLAVLPYVLKLAGKEGEGLLGKTEIEKTLVMSFLSFINTDLMSAAVKPYLVSIGYIPYDEAVISQALKDSYSYLKYLDDILAKSKYFTNSEAPNMADFYFVKFLCMLSNDLYSEECAAKFPHVNNLIQDVANNFELSKKVKGTKPTPNKLSFDAISK
ncbi:unnamed protein product [[Candida] boidinii]|uniref:Unnamed protein product n=1 Tax=Candida boidinii TaxID=5477 RepID=A0A9W6T1M6_CANBO|nr:hypothetical protein B5S30_g5478 [[Candida] boidinii]OWB86864.1 hypothetical protein B5S33_g5584 [[Candida] boidinii]GME71266.1 unnamed protein product [[Candida] boidinii]GMG05959.1 unnamed protein product [[Candida] boidinii]